MQQYDAKLKLTNVKYHNISINSLNATGVINVRDDKNNTKYYEGIMQSENGDSIIMIGYIYPNEKLLYGLYFIFNKYFNGFNCSMFETNMLATVSENQLEGVLYTYVPTLLIGDQYENAGNFEINFKACEKVEYVDELHDTINYIFKNSNRDLECYDVLFDGQTSKDIYINECKKYLKIK